MQEPGGTARECKCARSGAGEGPRRRSHASKGQRGQIDRGDQMRQATSRKRAIRSDAGTVRVTERDLRLLRVVGEQYAITLPQLARLMGRSNHAARWLRERWQAAGWVEARALLVGRPVFLWLTRRGLRAAGLDYAVWRPAAGALAHVEAVMDARLLVEGRHPDAQWVGERDLQRRGTHRPDGLVRLDGRESAIEVELTPKERRRAERIVRELVAAYPAVTYFATAQTFRLVSELAAEVGGGRVQVLPLPEGDR